MNLTILGNGVFADDQGKMSLEWAVMQYEQYPNKNGRNWDTETDVHRGKIMGRHTHGENAM